MFLDILFILLEHESTVRVAAQAVHDDEEEEWGGGSLIFFPALSIANLHFHIISGKEAPRR